jgi:hypothetical protein
MRDLLIERGWQSERIRVLTDAAAGRAAVIENIHWLVGGRKGDDSLLFSFSGHGSWTLTPDGRGWECCLCCSDCSDDWDKGVIARTDLNAAIERPTGLLEVILDCCFSGGMFPSYRTWTRLPAKVRKFLYDEDDLQRGGHDVRATVGPNWEPIELAIRRLGKPCKWVLSQIQEGKLMARMSLNGSVHVLVE